MRTLILGGAASGKSSWALRLARRSPRPWVFIATAEATDPEMEAKILRHQEERGPDFITLEAPVELPEVLARQAGQTVLVDCLTVWVGNLFHYQKPVEDYIERLLETVDGFSGRLILVSNEVSWGLLPPDPDARRYLYFLGRLNRELATRCEEVLLVVAGCPLPLKSGSERL